MQTALRLTGTVQPRGRVEVSSPELPSGKAVDVIVLLPRESEGSRRSVMDVLAEAPGPLAFQTAEEVDAYVQEEHGRWGGQGQALPLREAWQVGRGGDWWGGRSKSGGRVKSEGRSKQRPYASERGRLAARRRRREVQSAYEHCRNQDRNRPIAGAGPGGVSSVVWRVSGRRLGPADRTRRQCRAL